MNFKDTLFSVKHTINCGGTILNFNEPLVMGILNITPDSFYDGGRYQKEPDIMARMEQMIAEGADIIDIGGYSSRPNADDINEQEEKSRLDPALRIIRKKFPHIILSVDTFRAEIARFVVKEYGVHIINDISSGQMDNNMLEVVGSLNIPYIMMHMKGTPAIMQKDPEYADVVKELLSFFAERISRAKSFGIEDIIIDPGFGFGKRVSDNYTLLRELRMFELLGFPIMAGLSRKSMVCKPLGITPENALNATTVLHTMALNNGARILRVHDVKEAKQAIILFSLYQGSEK